MMPSSLHVVVDARVLEHRPTGIAKALVNMYTAMTEADPSVQVTLLHVNPLQTTIAGARDATHWRTSLSGRASREIGFPLAIRRLRPDLVHFPWNGGIPWTLR